MSTATLEEKQYLLWFKCDTKSHLTVLDHNVCKIQCPDSFVQYFAQLKFINGKDHGCREDKKAAMNAAAAESAVHIKILNGDIQKADMELYLG